MGNHDDSYREGYSELSLDRRLKESAERCLAAASDSTHRRINISPKAGEEVAHFILGDKVRKVGGDYQFEGVVVAVFRKLSGLVRYVVEDDRGVLHVYSFKNLAPR